MALIYITGAPGVGKSSIQKELTEAGYTAYDIDDRKLGGPYNKISGKLVIMPGVNLRTPEWFDQHEWRINIQAIEALKEQANLKAILVCGVAESDDLILHLFDKILYLEIDNDILAQRLSGRSKNDYGQNDFELQDILLRKKRLDEKYSGTNINKINANKSLKEVIQDIVSVIRV